MQRWRQVIVINCVFGQSHAFVTDSERLGLGHLEIIMNFAENESQNAWQQNQSSWPTKLSPADR